MRHVTKEARDLRQIVNFGKNKIAKELEKAGLPQKTQDKLNSLIEILETDINRQMMSKCSSLIGPSYAEMRRGVENSLEESNKLRIELKVPEVTV